MAALRFARTLAFLGTRSDSTEGSCPAPNAAAVGIRAARGLKVARSGALRARQVVALHATGGHAQQKQERKRALEPNPADRSEAPRGFEGMLHRDVLELRFEGSSCLVDDLVEKGTVGLIAGVPETGKSWLAHRIAREVARGSGQILGRSVVTQGPVAYFWQDDSERNEAERVQTYSRVHQTPDDLPVTWFLNVGLELPRHRSRCLESISRRGGRHPRQM